MKPGLQKEVNMEEMLNYSLKVLRERDFSRLEEDVQQAILSLFVDDNSKPSKLGRQTLAMHAGMLACWDR